MTTPRKDARWTNERCEQLTAMWDLWRMARSLNHSTNVIGNIQQLEELALKIRDAGFMHFLNDEAVRDRFANKP